MFQEPLRGPALVACALAVWLAGAAYCHGYERLLTGADEWGGSLIWSAAAVLPWFALFEWSKMPEGAEAARRPLFLLGLVLGIATFSILLEYLINWSLDAISDGLGLLILRRLPAIGIALLLIALARKAVIRHRASPNDVEIGSLAAAIDYVAAADNYVELHSRGRVTMRRMTLAEAERALNKQGFVRIHRRYLVNASRNAAVRGNGEQIVKLGDGTELPVGRRFAPNLQAHP
ncbi:MAG TPA: LytTR family DNA-binding domain-containing protein [Sphingomicrobium sp.]|nr:LytTR family DNA-binding domain-containing protein [Sphingomicrobium sp.]